ncbi:MAG: spore coat protein CotJB [Clostridia bacterium]|nr:spore coat protein CotJB [Clostridia bacterium]
MNDRQALLNRISVARFAAWELHIYLDTHPNDKQAMRNFEKYQKTADELTVQYEAKYGPLISSDVYGDTSWQWINAPWPWECGEVCD